MFVLFCFYRHQLHLLLAPYKVIKLRKFYKVLPFILTDKVASPNASSSDFGTCKGKAKSCFIFLWRFLLVC